MLQFDDRAQEREYAEALQQFLDSSLEASGLERRPDGHGGKGLFATRDLPRLQLSVPSRFILSQSSTSCTQLGKMLKAADFDAEDVMLVVLAEARCLQSESPFRPYAAWLPESAPDPASWAPEVAEALLSGTDLGLSLGPLSQELASLHSRLKEWWGSYEGQELLPEIEDLRWARGMMLSRRFPGDETDQTGKLGAAGVLVPVADMLNHSAEAAVQWITRATDFVLCGRQPLKKGAQVFINYGQETKSNEQLMALYGFAQRDNAADAVGLMLAGGRGDGAVCFIGRSGLNEEIWNLLLEDYEEDAALAALHDALAAQLNALNAGEPTRDSYQAVPQDVAASVQFYRAGLSEVLMGALEELLQLMNGESDMEDDEN